MERRKLSTPCTSAPPPKRRHIDYVKFRDETGAYCTAVFSGYRGRDDAARWAESRLAQ